MDSLDSAIHTTAHKDLPTLAKMMGLNEQSFRNKVSPTNEIAKLSVQEFRSMMLITQDVQPLRVLADDLGLKLVGHEVEASTVFDALLNFSKEQGDVAASIQLAFADNFFSEREYCAVENEIQQVKVALDVLLKSLQMKKGMRV